MKKIEILEKEWMGRIITIVELDEDVCEDRSAWDVFACPYITYLELGAASVAVYDEADRDETGIDVICAEFDVLDEYDKNIDVENKDDVTKLGYTRIKITGFNFG
ncbi:MAG: hypothetical protein ACYDEX_19480 [Mobilitalea sp.]